MRKVITNRMKNAVLAAVVGLSCTVATPCFALTYHGTEAANNPVNGKISLGNGYYLQYGYARNTIAEHDAVQFNFAQKFDKVLFAGSLGANQGGWVHQQDGDGTGNSTVVDYDNTSIVVRGTDNSTGTPMYLAVGTIGAVTDEDQEEVLKKKVSQIISDGTLDDIINSGNTTTGGDTHTKGNTTTDKDSHTKGSSTVDGDSTIGGNETIGKDLTVKGNATVEGNGTVNGNQTVGGDSTVSGSETVDKDLHVKGNGTIDGKTTLGGDADMKGNATVGKDLHVKGNETVDKDSHVKGNLTVDGTSTLKGDVSTGGNVEVGKDLTVKGNGSLDGDLTVSGKSEFKGDGTFDKNLTVKGDSDVKGNSHVGKDLTMDGNASIGKDLAVKGKTTLKDDATFEKNLTVKGDSDLQGNAQVGKDLTVLGDSDLQGMGHVGKDLTVDGTSTLKGDVAMGSNASVARNFSVGGDARIAGDLWVHDQNYIDSQGINANGHKVRNVADGAIAPGSKDAVNGGQLYDFRSNVNDRFNVLGDRMDNAVASAVALAGLHPLDYDPDNKLSFAVAGGQYHGATAGALGAFYRANDKFMVSLGGSIGREKAVNLGLSFSLDGKANSSHSSRKELLQTISTMKGQMSFMANALLHQRQEMEALKAKLDQPSPAPEAALKKAPAAPEQAAPAPEAPSSDDEDGEDEEE